MGQWEVQTSQRRYQVLRNEEGFSRQIGQVEGILSRSNNWFEGMQICKSGKWNWFLHLEMENIFIILIIILKCIILPSKLFINFHTEWPCGFDPVLQRISAQGSVGSRLHTDQESCPIECSIISLLCNMGQVTCTQERTHIYPFWLEELLCKSGK